MPTPSSGIRARAGVAPGRRSTLSELGRLSDRELLASRFCDLPVSLHHTAVARRARHVFSELKARGISVRPSIWLSEEWFNPDGVVGFAIPFYLAHPRLIRLERQLMLEAEGVAEADCLRILRHETGHAIDEAFQLYRTAEYRRTFGSPMQAYPTSYVIAPVSRDYVINLNAWYAQAHPVEDFAETFAVWLGSRNWPSRYRNWPALGKLRQIDRWMQQLGKRAPLQRNGAPVEGLQTNKRTLEQHYREKRAFYGVATSGEYDSALQRIFPPRSIHDRRQRSAASLLTQSAKDLRSRAGRQLGVPAYAVDQVLRQLTRRARALDLRVTRSRKTIEDAVVKLLTRATIKLLEKGQRLPL